MTRKYVITGFGAKNSLGTMIAAAILDVDPSAYVIGIYAPDVHTMESGIDIAECIMCDLSNYTDLVTAFSGISNIHMGIDCLINCAGINKMDWFKDVDVMDYDRVQAVNSSAPIWATQELLRALTAAKGTVLNIISMGAHKPFRTSLAYNVSKAGLLMATKQLARELRDITVFGISPAELKGTGMTLDNCDEICKIRNWTPEQASSPNQIDPNKLAEFIAYLLHKKENHQALNGVDLCYGD